MQDSEIASINHELIDQLESLYCFFQSLKTDPTFSSFTTEEKMLIKEQSYMLTAQGFTQKHFNELYSHNIDIFRRELGSPVVKKVFIEILMRKHIVVTSIISYFEVRYVTLNNKDNDLLKRYRRLLKETLKISEQYKEKLTL